MMPFDRDLGAVILNMPEQVQKETILRDCTRLEREPWGKDKT